MLSQTNRCGHRCFSTYIYKEPERRLLYKLDNCEIRETYHHVSFSALKGRIRRSSLTFWCPSGISLRTGIFLNQMKNVISDNIKSSLRRFAGAYALYMKNFR